MICGFVDGDEVIKDTRFESCRALVSCQVESACFLGRKSNINDYCSVQIKSLVIGDAFLVLDYCEMKNNQILCKCV